MKTESTFEKINGLVLDQTKATPMISFKDMPCEVVNRPKINNDYSDSCKVVSDELRFELNFEVLIYSYIYANEKNINGKWVHCDPRKSWYKIDDIILFREQNDHDKYDNDIHYISENTIMPTKWCMMEYHDRYEKKRKVIPVVGTVKELDKKCSELLKQYYKERHKMYDNEDKLREYFKSL